MEFKKLILLSIFLVNILSKIEGLESAGNQSSYSSFFV